MTARVYAAIAFAIAILAAIGFIYNKGRRAALDAVERVNHEAVKQGVEGASDVRSCVAAGGVWSIHTGKCRRFEPGDSQ